jgi:hypothetical protein
MTSLEYSPGSNPAHSASRAGHIEFTRRPKPAGVRGRRYAASRLRLRDDSFETRIPAQRRKVGVNPKPAR